MSVLPAGAQTVFDRNGFGENRGTYSALPYEHVDPLSGNLLLVVTDLALPGNGGLGVQVQRVYNSAVYPDYENNSLALEEDSWAGIGWRLHFGRVLNEGANGPGATEIEMGDGGRHPLFTTTARPEGWITKNFWVYDKSTHTLKLPNGVVYTFGHQVFLNARLGMVRYVTAIRDAFNNEITFTYFGAPGPPDGVAMIRQVLGPNQVREITFTYHPTLKSLASMTYDGRTWTYGQQAFGPAGYSALGSVQPPAGKAWIYTYESAPGYVGLASMLVPSGGVVSYTYGDATRFAGSVQKRARVVTRRSISGHAITPGTWDFTYSTGPNRDQSVVACPCGTTRYRYQGIGNTGDFSAWSTGALLERTVEDGTGAVLEREVLTWQRSEAISPDAVPPVDGLWGDPDVFNALLQRRVITRGGPSWTTDYEYRTGLGTYNDHGQPWRVTEGGGITRVTTREFASGFTAYIRGPVASEKVRIAPEEVTSSWTYDLATGFLRDQTVLGIRTQFAPTAAGNVATVTDANGHQTSFQYQWGVASRVQTPLLTTTRTITPAGLVADETLGDLTTRYEYDLAFRPKVIRPPSTNPIVYEYDGLHQEWVRVARDQAQTSMQLDGFGRVIVTTNPTNVKTRTTRDACGQAIFASAPYTAGAGDRGVTMTYDALGRVQRVTAADNSATQYFYNDIDVTIRDAENRDTFYDYDAFGGPGGARLRLVRDANNQPTAYLYDVLGNLTQVAGPATTPARTWAYDARGLVLETRQPESGLTTYVHDAAGRLTQTRDASHQVTNLHYDANNRITRRDASGSSADITYTYDSHGRLSTMTASALVGVPVTTTYTYDVAGRLAQRSDQVDGRTFSSTYAYDLNDNLTQITYPAFPSGRRVVSYAYDIKNRLTAVRQNGALFAHSFTYDDAGRLASYVTGAVTHTMTFDTRDRVRSITAGTGSPNPAHGLHLTYDYDRVSRVLQITDPRANMTQAFGYDVLDRLTSATGPYGTIGWAYDAAGNRLSETRGTGTTVYAYNAAKQRLTQTQTSGAAAETFTYNNIGELTKDSRGDYTYTEVGLLRTVTAPNLSAAYYYDPEDLRIRRDVNGRKTYTIRSPGGDVLSEYEEQCGTLVWTRDQVHAGGKALGAVRANLAQPTITFETAATAVAETVGAVTPRVRITTASGAPLTCGASVTFVSQAGSAAEGSDYGTATGTIAIPAGTASGTAFTLSPAIGIVNDATYESEEQFTVVLTGATGAVVGAASTHLVRIISDDAAPNLTINDVLINEAAATATFTVAVSALSEVAIHVSYGTADSTARSVAPHPDYVPAAGVLTIPVRAATGVITVPILDDGHAEAAESFLLSLTGPLNAGLADATGVATIQDNERPRAPIDTSKPGLYFSDGTAAAGHDNYVAIGNRHSVPVAARLTFTRNDGSGIVRDVLVPTLGRLTLRLGDDPALAGEEVSFVVQSMNPAFPLQAEHVVYSDPDWEAGRATEGVTLSPTWYFAEGAIGHFEELITIFNPTSEPMVVTAEYFDTNGPAGTFNHHIEPGPGRVKFPVRSFLGPREHGTRLTARTRAGVPMLMAAERASFWPAGASGWESHSSPGVSGPQWSWHFAEGNTGFATYLLLLNTHPAAQTATVTYLHENGQQYATTVTIPASARITVPMPAWLPLGSFGARVVAHAAPLVAERVMYGGPDWTLGHAGSGLQPATVWVFEEGSTGAWDTYLLLANAAATPTSAQLWFTRADGVVVRHDVAIPALSRLTVSVDAIPGMADTLFRSEVIASQPIVAERATYWFFGAAPLSLAGSGSPPGLNMLGGRPPGGGLAESTTNGAGTTGTVGNTSSSSGFNPYTTLVRAVNPPHFYTVVTEGVPLGPTEQALAAQAAADEAAQRTAGAAPGQTNATPNVTTSGGWYGAHLTGGRQP